MMVYQIQQLERQKPNQNLGPTEVNGIFATGFSAAKISLCVERIIIIIFLISLSERKAVQIQYS